MPWSPRYDKHFDFRELLEASLFYFLLLNVTYISRMIYSAKVCVLNFQLALLLLTVVFKSEHGGIC